MIFSFKPFIIIIIPPPQSISFPRTQSTSKQPKGYMALKNASLQAIDKSKRTHVFEINSAISKNKILYVQGTLHRNFRFTTHTGVGR